MNPFIRCSVVFALSLVFGSVVAFPSDFRSMIFDFFAPTVDDAESGAVEQVGSIVFDRATGRFRGLTPDGTWINLSVSQDSVNADTYACAIDNNGSTAFVDTTSGLCDEWIQSVSRSSLGTVAVTLKTSAFSAEPVCVASVKQLGPNTATVGATSATTLTVETNNAGSKIDYNFMLICRGKI